MELMREQYEGKIIEDQRLLPCNKSVHYREDLPKRENNQNKSKKKREESLKKMVSCMKKYIKVRRVEDQGRAIGKVARFFWGRRYLTDGSSH
jgi:hypothetical protein